MCFFIVKRDFSCNKISQFFFLQKSFSKLKKQKTFRKSFSSLGNFSFFFGKKTIAKTNQIIGEHLCSRERKNKENVRKISFAFIVFRATINLFNLIIRCFAFSMERKTFGMFLPSFLSQQQQQDEFSLFVENW